MVITKTPFRVSFCGGGSDISDFYQEHEGCVLSTSINQYMYISVHPYFDRGFTSLKYSQNELVKDPGKISHSILRCVLTGMKINGVEIVSTADIPSGTGLGSSSAFTVGLIHALYAYQGKCISKKELAELACDTEINQLGNPIGKQDQYAAAFGGLNFITFHRDGQATVEPLIIKSEMKQRLQDHLVMFYTGRKHDANAILREQKRNIPQKEKTDNLIQMCRLAKQMKRSLETGDLPSIGSLLHEGWMRKKELAQGITRPEIDELYEKAIRSGASGGKLLGAGGGGFLLFYCAKEKQDCLKKSLGLEEFPFRFEQDGSVAVHIGETYW